MEKKDLSLKVIRKERIVKILLVEDNNESRNYLETFLRKIGHSVITSNNGIEALENFETQVFDLVLTEIQMPEMTGIELLRKISVYKDKRDFDVLIFTGSGDMESAIESFRLGVTDYLLKPIDIKILADILKRLEENQETRRSNQKIIKKFTSGVSSEFNQIQVNAYNAKLPTIVPGIGKIDTFLMDQIVDKAIKFHKDRSLPVLILGETGTGKEVVARLIHYGYSNTDEPFVDLNCATLTPSLFESELFGYEAGAYTGAQMRGGKGKIDLAMGGTLFLDEIGELCAELQAKLLRVIQEKEYFRVGGLKKIHADVRIICATNVDIRKMVKEGRFRRDLYCRLNVGQFVLPPLRERKDSIIPLAEMFINEFCTKRSKKLKYLSEQAKEVLLDYSWPGNVRELRNLMELVVFYFDEDEVKAKHLSSIASDSPNDPLMPTSRSFVLSDQAPGSEVKRLVDELITEALELNNGNKAKTARFLGMARKTLYRHLNRLNKLNEAE